jgi:lipopolysaccharide export system protein LptC
MTADATRTDAGLSRTRSTFVLVTEDERARAYRLALRHTRRVRLLKMVLPLCALLSFGGYFASPTFWLRSIDPSIKGSVSDVELTTTRLRMINPRYEGFTSDNGHYVVSAKVATQAIDSQEELDLEGVTGKLTQVDQSWMTLAGKTGHYHLRSKQLTLASGIDINTSSKVHAALERADLDLTTRTVTSDVPVAVDMPNGSVQAIGLEIENEKRRVLFKSNVVAHLVPPPNSAPKPQPQPEQQQQPAAGFAMPTLGSGPVTITSEELEILDNAKSAVFRRKVVAREDEMTLEANELNVGYAGGASGQALDPTLSSSSISSAVAKGNVIITSKDGRRALADASRYDRARGTMTLIGHVQLQQGGNVLFADQASIEIATRHTIVTSDSRVRGHFEPSRPVQGAAAPVPASGLGGIAAGANPVNIEADRLEMDGDVATFTGSVIISQKGNKLAGERLDADMTKRQMTLSGPGRVTGSFAQLAAPSSATAKKKTTISPTADPIGQSLAGLSASSAELTQVEADTLTVDDVQGLANFAGKVLVVRGGHRITAEQLSIAYQGGGANASEVGSQVSTIMAQRNVVVKTPDNQVATSDKLLFESARNLLTLTGNVIVTQADKNVIRGDRMVVDLNTGESHVEMASPIAGSTSVHHRIQVLITPDGIQQMGSATKSTKNGKPTTPMPSDGDGLQASGQSQ